MHNASSCCISQFDDARDTKPRYGHPVVAPTIPSVYESPRLLYTSSQSLPRPANCLLPKPWQTQRPGGGGTYQSQSIVALESDDSPGELTALKPPEAPGGDPEGGGGGGAALGGGGGGGASSLGGGGGGDAELPGGAGEPCWACP